MKIRFPSLFDLFSSLSLPQWVLAGGMFLGVGAAFPSSLHAQIDEIEEEDFDEVSGNDDAEMDADEDGDDEPAPFDFNLIRPAVRSVNESPNHPVDNRDRPHYRERTTHHGYEVVGDHYTVFARTSMEDARWAAREVGKAWSEVSSLADRFTNIHRRPNFGVGAFTVVIDNRPADGRTSPGKTTVIGGNQPAIHVYVGEGAPALRDQVVAIRRATSETFLNTTQLNRTLPVWVQTGLSDYVSNLGSKRAAGPIAPPGAAFAPAVDAGPAVPGRGTPDQLAANPADTTAEQKNASLWVKYLIEGDDARHAPAFFAALAAAQDDSDGPPPTRVDRARPPKQDDAEFADEGSENDELVNLLSAGAAPAGGIGEWIQEPNVDLPLVPSYKDGTTPALTQRQQEMLTILKLARRFEKAAGGGGVKPRVTEFGAAGQKEVQAINATSTGGDLSTLLDRLSESPEPWATLDAEGKLLFSDEQDRLEELFGVGEHRYATDVRNGKLVLTTRIDATTTISAWLEENPQQPRRPLARFTIESNGLSRPVDPSAIPSTDGNGEERPPASVPAATPEPIRSGYRLPSNPPALPPTIRR